MLILLKLFPDEGKKLKELCAMTGYTKKELLREGMHVLYAKQKYGVDYPKLKPIRKSKIILKGE